MHGDAAGREPDDRDVPGIAPEGSDVSLHPLQRRDLVHVGVVALGLLRALMIVELGRSQRELLL